ncbi:MAG: hypothetical protein PUI31_02405 [Clostridia bacterium]|nr:hypothetical protein [Clostridia bacterium]MDD7165516.1 hypothetical protein [Clostridia bacterium]
MTDEQIVKVMIEKVETIVREKVKEDFNAAKPTDRKTVSKAIINELEAVMADEN